MATAKIWVYQNAETFDEGVRGGASRAVLEELAGKVCIRVRSRVRAIQE